TTTIAPDRVPVYVCEFCGDDFRQRGDLLTQRTKRKCRRARLRGYLRQGLHTEPEDHSQAHTGCRYREESIQYAPSEA
ncbi:unnamed protein product, partial [Closterium sp. NIES-64]